MENLSSFYLSSARHALDSSVTKLSVSILALESRERIIEIPSDQFNMDVALYVRGTLLNGRRQEVGNRCPWILF